MPSRPRNNTTPDGAKRRWTPEDRQARSGGRSGRPAAADRGAPAERTGGPRAARREAAFGTQDERGTGRPNRRVDWTPGPRNGKRTEGAGSERSARPERDGRPGRSAGYERPQRSNGFNRTGRPDAPGRPERAGRPESGRFERGARGESASRPDRTGRPDAGVRAGRRSRPDSGERYERPAQQDRSAGVERSERPARQERPDRTERPRWQDRGARPAPDGRRPDRRAAETPRETRGSRSEPWTGRDRPTGQSDRSQGSRSFGRDDRAQRFEHPQDLVLQRLVGEVVTPDQVAGSSFADLGLGEQITKALAELGATEPFPIQAATIPHALAGRNVLGRGRTGSGKTIAFGAALVERLLRNWADAGRTGSGRRMGRPPRALVLAPTRELALQIDRTIQPIARSVGLYTTQIVGGVPQGRQVGALAKGVDIVIGTPGRIEDLLEQRRLDLADIEIAVLDEADHMADLGFLEPMQRLLRRVPAKGQRMLFSATLDSAVAQLVEEFLPNPAVHEVADVEGSGTADHRVLVIEQGEKLPVLAALVGASERSLVFARTRAFAEQLADDLDGEGVRTESLHGDLNQARRTRNLARFSEGKVAALVATDVAARGIHVDDIGLVVHADAAEDYKTYLHRSGRTGRAGASGTVVTLITARRRRGFTELLERAGIEAEFVVLRSGDDPVAAIGR